jgi:hypothetical protein
MSSPTPFLPPILEILNEMVTSNAIPALNGNQMATLSSYLFAIPDRELRIQIAEIAYRNYGDPQALDVFLACTIPLAKRISERKAYRVFGLPSDWQLECMYDGSVSALLAIFEHHAPLSSLPNAFRRYLLRTLGMGSLRNISNARNTLESAQSRI